MGGRLTVHPAVAAKADVQKILSTRHANVEKTSFLLDLFSIVLAVLVGQELVFDTHNENTWPLETLGRVQGADDDLGLKKIKIKNSLRRQV